MALYLYLSGGTKASPFFRVKILHLESRRLAYLLRHCNFLVLRVELFGLLISFIGVTIWNSLRQ